jgi:hypothetical protein
MSSEPATPKQIAYLTFMGVRHAERLSRDKSSGAVQFGGWLGWDVSGHVPLVNCRVESAECRMARWEEFMILTPLF